MSNAPIAPQRPLDGVNLVPYVTGAKEGVPHEAIYLRKFDQQCYAVRSGDHKLVILGARATPQLYNLRNDIGETTNLADTDKPQVNALDKLRKTWDAELIDPVFLGLIHTPAYMKKRKKAKTP